MNKLEDIHMKKFYSKHLINYTGEIRPFVKKNEYGQKGIFASLHNTTYSKNEKDWKRGLNENGGMRFAQSVRATSSNRDIKAYKNSLSTSQLMKPMLKKKVNPKFFNRPKTGTRNGSEPKLSKDDKVFKFIGLKT